MDIFFFLKKEFIPFKLKSERRIKAVTELAITKTTKIGENN